MNRITLGRLGEQAAYALLERQGWRIEARNWRCRLGELDLVGHPPIADAPLVFIEVRTRRQGGSYGTPAESVDIRKQRRLQTLSQVYLRHHGLTDGRIRFDVIAVLLDRSAWEVAEIKHIEAAF